jgi:hypothetical protein
MVGSDVMKQTADGLYRGALSLRDIKTYPFSPAKADDSLAETAMPVMWRFALRARHAVPLRFQGRDGSPSRPSGFGETALPLDIAASFSQRNRQL